MSKSIIEMVSPSSAAIEQGQDSDNGQIETQQVHQLSSDFDSSLRSTALLSSLHLKPFQRRKQVDSVFILKRICQRNGISLIMR